MQARSVRCSKVSACARDPLQEDGFHPVLAMHLFFQLRLQHMCCSKIYVDCPALPSCLTDSHDSVQCCVLGRDSFWAKLLRCCCCLYMPNEFYVVNRTRVRCIRCSCGACCAWSNQLLVPMLVCIFIHRTGS